MLIAFLLVSSLFSIAVIQISNETRGSTELVNEHLAEVIPALKLRGIVVGLRAGDGEEEPYRLDRIKFSIASKISDPVEVTSDSIVITYRDIMQFVPDIPWSGQWLRGQGDKLDPDELAEITLDLSDLSPKLAASTLFSVEIKQFTSADIEISLVTPPSLELVTELPSFPC